MYNVLALTYYFPRISETFILDQLSYVNRHCNLTIYSLYDPSSMLAREDLCLEDVQHPEADALRSRVVYEEDRGDLTTLKELLKNNFDILHFQFGEFYSKIAGMLGGHRCILTLHTIANLRLLDGCEDFSRLTILPTSRYLEEKVKFHFPIRAHRAIALHYLGVDIERYSPSFNTDKLLQHQDFTVVLNGRFVEKKGHFMALNAFHRVVKEIPNARLVLIGDGVLREKIQNQINLLGLSGNVIFTGKLIRDEVISWYGKCDIGIQPSESGSGSEEGLPTSVMEYSSMALPVIACRHAGIPEVVRHGETGFIIEEGDSSALASYILQLARDRQLAQRMGHEGRVFMLSHFDIREKNRELLNIYDANFRNN